MDADNADVPRAGCCCCPLLLLLLADLIWLHFPHAPFAIRDFPSRQNQNTSSAHSFLPYE